MADPLPLAQALIRCRSVTPADDGALAWVAAQAERLGFTVTRLDYGVTGNLFARLGTEAPCFCFAGHTDVVPPGAGWAADPFGAAVEDGRLIGRGAVDMKGAIAAFLAACQTFLEAGPPRGSIALLITGDEEGDAVDGTARVLEWMASHGQRPDFTLVGEPTCRARLGDTIKIGRRGSLNATIRVTGRQGHVAYPDLAANPIHPLIAALADLAARELDAGTDWFAPSSLQITSVDVGNEARNVIPPAAEARLNIRFNDRHSEASLVAWLRETLLRHTPDVALETRCGAHPFLTAPGPSLNRLRRAVETGTGMTPSFETGGGTSDARFIARYGEVAEFGLVGTTMHQVGECVPVPELRQLSVVYQETLREFLS